MDTRKQIEKLAYEIFERNGSACGFDFDHWIEAEKIISGQLELKSASKKAMVKKSSKAAPRTRKPASAKRSSI